MKFAKRLFYASMVAGTILAAVSPWLLVSTGHVQARGYTIDVTAAGFGAVGDGTTDDSAAFQRAIDALEPTGGSLYVPPNRCYRVKDVEINSIYPIWITSEMGNHLTAGGTVNTWSSRVAIRPTAGAAYIFKWELHTSITTPGFGAGGGIRGICFTDFNTAGSGLRGTDFQIVSLTNAAVWVTDAAAFTVEGCEFQGLQGTAFKVDLSTYCKLLNNKWYYCGDDSPAKPVIDIGGGASQATVWLDWNFIENHYHTHIKLNTNGSIRHRNGYHENSGGVASVTFIDGSTAGVAYISNGSFNNTTGVAIDLGANTGTGFGHVIEDCVFYNFPGANRTIWIRQNSVKTRLSNLTIGAPGQTGRSIEIDSNESTLDNIYTEGGGGIQIDGERCIATNIYCRVPDALIGVYAIDMIGNYNTLNGGMIWGNSTADPHGVRGANCTITNFTVRDMENGNGITTTGVSTVGQCRCLGLGTGTRFVVPNSLGATTFWGNYSDTGNTGKTLTDLSILGDLLALREDGGSGDVGNIVANGGVLASDTTPKLEGDANAVQQIVWAAADQTAMIGTMALPANLDDTRDIQVDVFVSTDNTNGGGIDAASFTINTSFDAAVEVIDTLTDTAPATTFHTASGTIGNLDVPVGARSMSFRIAPAVHASDPVRLHGFRFRAYTLPVSQNF